MSLYEDFMRDAEQSAKQWQARRDLAHERERQRRQRNRDAFTAIIGWLLFFALCGVLIILATTLQAGH